MESERHECAVKSVQIITFYLRPVVGSKVDKDANRELGAYHIAVELVTLFVGDVICRLALDYDVPPISLNHEVHPNI